MKKSPVPLVVGLGLALVVLGAISQRGAQASPSVRTEVEGWLEKIAAGALDVFDGLDPMVIDRLLASDLLNPAQRIIVERLRRR